MQCSSCRFENMPGVDVCGRCSSPLNLATMVIDVNPPRATPWQKRLRRLPGWTTVPRARYEFRETWRDVKRFAAFMSVPMPPWGLLLRLPVPGWPYFYAGQPDAGRLVMAIYCLLLLPTVVFAGSGLGALLLGLLVALHAGSGLLLLFRNGGRLLVRLATSALVLAFLAFAIYQPAIWAVTRVARPVLIQHAAGELAEGEVLLVNQLAYDSAEPQPGDVVVYRLGHLRGNNAHRQAIYLLGGENMDRILAGPETDVFWEHGKLFLNGVESPLVPLNPAWATAKLSLRVPAGHYLIVPSMLEVLPPATPDGMWNQVFLVMRDNIEGKVYWRTQPLTRFGRFP